MVHISLILKYIFSPLKIEYILNPCLDLRKLFLSSSPEVSINLMICLWTDIQAMQELVLHVSVKRYICSYINKTCKTHSQHPQEDTGWCLLRWTSKKYLKHLWGDVLETLDKSSCTSYPTGRSATKGQMLCCLKELFSWAGEPGKCPRGEGREIQDGMPGCWDSQETWVFFERKKTESWREDRPKWMTPKGLGGEGRVIHHLVKYHL